MTTWLPKSGHSPTALVAVLDTSDAGPATDSTLKMDLGRIAERWSIDFFCQEGTTADGLSVPPVGGTEHGTDAGSGLELRAHHQPADLRSRGGEGLELSMADLAEPLIPNSEGGPTRRESALAERDR